MDIVALLQDFHFIRPYWLIAIVPALLLTWWISTIKGRQSGWQTVVASHLYQRLVSQQPSKKERPPYALLALAWVIGCFALAGPTWQKLPQPVYQVNLGKVVLLDMSMSMRATDLSPDRLTRAKYKTIDLVNALNEGETGLVAYAGDAFTISPLSSDVQNLTTLIPSVTPEIMPVPGSDPVLGIQAATELLQNAGYQQGDIFWVTDGVTNQQMKELSETLNRSQYRVSILAVGTEQGAPIKLVDGELKKDRMGAIVIPKLTTNNLRSLSKITGGRYAPIQNDDSDIDHLTQQKFEVEQQEANQDSQQFGDKWQEFGPYLVLLLLPLAAYAFRRGLLTALALVILLPAHTPNAQANWWQDMWQTQDQQAIEAYKQQQYEQAASTFDDPMWQGNAHYRNKNYQQAVDAYTQLNTPQALYNKGNALAQLGELDQAIDAYDQVLAAQPDHQQAQANKALLEQMKQQQEQEQQNQDNQDNQESDQQQGDEQQSDPSQGDQSESAQQDGQQQDSEQSQQQKSGAEQANDAENDPQSEQQNAQQNNEQQDNGQQGNDQQQNDAQSSEQESNEAGSAEQSEPQTPQQAGDAEGENQAAGATQQSEPLTDEQKEHMQRMQMLLNKVPDDPAFLLKRKMQIEAQRRQRDRLPTRQQQDW